LTEKNLERVSVNKQTVLIKMVGIGIFGCNEIVKVLVPILKEKGFNVVAIWGSKFEEAEKTAKLLNIPFYTSKIDDVLLRKDVDLIFVMTKPLLHSQISVKGLGIGKHLLCDKPCGKCNNMYS
jgi:predicted dehydrogenase